MAAPKPKGEFERIATFFAPLAGPEALGLADDAAVLAPTPGMEIVLTTDTMVAGVHFLAGDAPGQIARKLLRVNLSDLAAMGARPRGYLLASSWRRDTTDDWIAAFAQGLALDQREFGCALLGGDTTATAGPVVLTVTAVGEVEAGLALRRNGARAGDDVYVSGTIGDAVLGLKLAKGELALAAAPAGALLERHRLPVPRLALGRALVGRARAAIDISDGLAADLGHIGETSGLGAEIEAASVPLSPAARHCLAAGLTSMAELITGGDDYELCFTLPAGAAPPAGGIACTRIGRMVEAAGVRLRDAAGAPIALGATGFRHF